MLREGVLSPHSKILAQTTSATRPASVASNFTTGVFPLSIPHPRLINFNSDDDIYFYGVWYFWVIDDALDAIDDSVANVKPHSFDGERYDQVWTL